MPVCSRCRKRQAKRSCPALRANICPVCCAQERMIELACPESCQYLRDAREQAVERQGQFQAKELEPGEAAVLARMGSDERLIPLLHAIDQAIVTVQREKLRDLQDAEALAALENAVQNLETESSGLIYEHRTGSPRVQIVSEAIRSQLEEIAGHEMFKVRPTRSEVMGALKLARFRVLVHVRRAERDPRSSRAFVRQAALFYPWPEEATMPLIV